MMGPWIKVVLWTAIVVLPGGLMLLPLVVADQLQRMRRQPPGGHARGAPR